MSDDFFSQDYTAYVPKTSLEAMPYQLPGSDVSKVVSGTDSAANAQANTTSEPRYGWGDAAKSMVDVLLNTGGGNSADAVNASIKAGIPASQTAATAGQKISDTAKKILYGALFVVIGLFIISRGFGLIGEEGASVALNIEDPTKYPGIGHAVQAIKRKKKG
jgi:hypothetical protein